MSKVKIDCTVNYNGNYSLAVNPDPATADVGDDVEWTIDEGTGLPSNVQSVAIENITKTSGTDVFSGPGGEEPAAEPNTSGKKWKGTVATDTGGDSENYTVYYTVTLSDGTVNHEHDPELRIPPPGA